MVLGTFAQIEPAGPFCATDGPQQLLAQPDSGRWGGAADSTGVFDPSVGHTNSPYLVTYSFIDSLGVEQFYLEWIEVLRTPRAVIEPAGPFCEGDGIHLLQAVDSGGVWNGPFGVISSDGWFDAWLGELGSPYEITYTVQDTGSGCVASDTVEIIVGAVPDVSIEPFPPVLCLFDRPVQGVGLPEGGVWGGAADSTGLFTPMDHNGGGLVTYLYADSISGCRDSAQQFVTVLNAIIPEFLGPESFCTNQQPAPVEFVPSNGIYGGPVSQSGVFDPSIGPGSYEVTFSTDCPGCCAYTDTVRLSVYDPAPVQTLDPGPFCNTDVAVTLVGFPSDGSWSGDVDTTGLFHPSIGPGEFQAVYLILDSNGCNNSDTLALTVLGAPEVNLLDAGPFCLNDSAYQFTASPNTGYFSWGGAVDTNGVFQADQPGNYTVSYTYQDSAGCSNSDSVQVVVYDLPDVLVNTAGPFCASDSIVQLFATPTGGLWSGAVNVTGLFDPSMGENGSPYAAFYSVMDTNGCTNGDTTELIVTDPPELIIDPVDTLCVYHEVLQLSASPENGIWGGAASLDGLFDPSAGAGTYTVTYFVNDGTCEVLAELDIVVDLCVGLNERNVQPARIFPNPNDGLFYIEWPNMRDASIEIFDALGRYIEGSIIYPDQKLAQVDLSAEPAGLYFIQIQLDGGIYVQQVVLRR